MRSKRKKLALMLTVLMFLGNILNNFTIISAQDMNYLKSIRLTDVFEEQIAIMQQNSREVNSSTVIEDINIKSVYEVKDFDENVFTVVECDPIGYMIYHNESGNFIEYSPATHSPFWGTTGDIRYVGPNEYYVCDVGSKTYRYVFDKQELTSAEISELKKHSKETNEILIKNKNQNTLDYINGETNACISCNSEENGIALLTETYNGFTVIDGYEFFTNMGDCGYVSGGKCGYIAAAMLLAYDKAVNGKSTMSGLFLDQTTDVYGNVSYSIDPYFTHCLYVRGTELGYGNSTTSVEIHYTVEKWLAERGITVNHTSLYIPFGSDSTIVSKLKVNRPVIWFGYVSDNDYDGSTGNHAIVVYGYKSSWFTTEFVAHFGWNGANEVYFSGILGSVYTYEW